MLIAPDSAGGGDCDLDYMELGKWALLPQDDETLEELVRMGRRDAERWVRTRRARGRRRPRECGRRRGCVMIDELSRVLSLSSYCTNGGWPSRASNANMSSSPNVHPATSRFSAILARLLDRGITICPC